MEIDHEERGARRSVAKSKWSSGDPIRAIRWILGPPTPIPQSELPKPTTSTRLSFTVATHSSSLHLDPLFTRMTRSLRLKRVLIPFLLLWATANVLLIRQQYYRSTPPIISCDAPVWDDWPPDVCGLNVTECADELVGGTYRCMGGCRDASLGNPRWIGGEEIDGVPLIIGGGDGNHTYRADSWVCPSAIHAGLISHSLGGCVTLYPLPYPTGSSDFLNITAHGLTSSAFAPHFPGAFTLSSTPSTGCIDLHPTMTGFNAFCLLLTTLFLAPSPAILFSTLIILGYLQIVLFSDPPSQPPDWSYILGGILSVLFTSYWIYYTSFRRTLTAFMNLPFDVTWWQGAGYWIGIESCTIFAKLPIQRLGYGGLSSAGVITLIIIILVGITVVAVQAWQMRKAGLLQYYLLRYLPLVPILIILANIPGYTLRLHHYLFSLAAIPVLSLPNRVSLFGQAFALGLFLDGVGRWGWDSILESNGSLLGDAVAGTGTPYFLNSSTADILSWVPMNTSLVELGYNGVSLLLDDVQQLVNYTESTLPLGNLSLTAGIEHFFRLSWMVNGTSLDYTDPAVLGVLGNWTMPV